ncbi:MAG: thioredoxin domain-containing protein [Minisyncoccia bacterium]|jgi:protein-disulfide isomerase
MEPEKQKRDYLLPASILIAGLMVTVALVYNAGKKTENQAANLADSAAASAQLPSPANMKPISEADHILGDPNAPLKIVEFSDLECPFCKVFHATLHQVMQTYAGKIAWIYRQFPIPQLHPKAPHEAQAAECAAKLGGNDKFWAFIDNVFEITPSNNGLDPAELPKIASNIGLDVAQFNSCLASTYGQDKIQNDTADAGNSGAQGTPYAVVVNSSGKKFVINGALPFDQVSAIINTALK